MNHQLTSSVSQTKVGKNNLKLSGSQNYHKSPSAVVSPMEWFLHRS